MNIETSTPTAPAYRPRTVTITLESMEDATLLDHVIGCWCDQEHCDRRAEVKAFMKQLQFVLDRARIHER